MRRHCPEVCKRTSKIYFHVLRVNEERHMIEWERGDHTLFLVHSYFRMRWGEFIKQHLRVPEFKTPPAHKDLLCVVPYLVWWWSCVYIKSNHRHSAWVMQLWMTFLVDCDQNTQWGIRCRGCFSGHLDLRWPISACWAHSQPSYNDFIGPIIKVPISTG